MKNEFVLAFNEVLEEKGLPREVIVKALESAMVSAYRRAVNASNAQQIDAKIDLETGKVTIFADKEVVEQVQDTRTEVSLPEARHYNPDAELGQMVVVESTPRDFGRVAAQTARQVIQQRIRDAERQAQLAYYEKQIGEIVSGIVQAVNAQGLSVGLEMRAEGNMPRKEMIPGERFRIHDRVRALLAEVKDTPRGPQIILSRTHRNFLRRLLETEVPEIYHGIVEIRSIAREPGERAKVAVYATQQGIDPVGACVGIRGVRIQAIVRELHDEKIDVIEWNPDPALYIAKALSPARVLGVYLNEKNSGGKTATVVVPEDQLSLAIGRDGQNARLAAKLTGWRIDIKSLPEATADVVQRLQTDSSLAAMVEVDPVVFETIESLLARKAENRPLTPEEYDRMAQFVDRVEKRVMAKRQPDKKAEDRQRQEVLRGIPEEVFAQNILNSHLDERVAYSLLEAGYSSIGDLIVQMKINPDEILKIQGIGPRAMLEIQNIVEAAEAVQKAALSANEVIEPEPGMESTLPAIELAAMPLDVVTPVDTNEVAEPLLTVQEQLQESGIDEVVQTEGQEVIQVMSSPELVTETTVSQDEGELEEETSFNELFTLRPEVISEAVVDEEEEDDISSPKGKKKGKKKGRKHVEIEFDPDAGRTIIHKKHKRGGGDSWDW